MFNIPEIVRNILLFYGENHTICKFRAVNKTFKNQVENLFPKFIKPFDRLEMSIGDSVDTFYTRFLLWMHNDINVYPQIEYFELKDKKIITANIFEFLKNLSTFCIPTPIY